MPSAGPPHTCRKKGASRESNASSDSQTHHYSSFFLYLILGLQENTAGRPLGDDGGATRRREKLYTCRPTQHLKDHSSFNLDGAAVSLSHTHDRDFCQHGYLFQRVRER